MATKPIPGFSFSLATVLDEESQRYSSTSVYSDRTGTGHLRVNSNIQHHHAQSIWVRTDAGREEHYTFNDAGIPAVRPGHRVLLSFAQKIGVVRVENLTSGSWQTIAPYDKRWATKFFIIVSAICILFALVMPWAISACITPIIGVVMLLADVFEDRKWRRLGVYRTSTVGLACALMASSSLLIILSAMDPHARPGTVPTWPMFFFIGLWFWAFLIALKRRQEASEHLRHREAIEQDFRELNTRRMREASGP